MLQKGIDIRVKYYSDRLLKKLDLLRTSKAAIVEAPSGFGKTTAIRDYLNGLQVSDEAAIWFTAVDEAPPALYRRFCQEIDKIDGNVGRRLLDIGFPGDYKLGEACDALRGIKCGRETWLVLDDFHLIYAALPAPFLTALFEQEAKGLHIILITQYIELKLHSTAAGKGVPHIAATDLQWEAGDISRYFAKAGVDINKKTASELRKQTGGWIIAVYLQLSAYAETGVFSDDAVFRLIEHLVWNKLTDQQQELLMRISVFYSCTAGQICGLLDCGELPDYALECLSAPFIRYISDQRLYEPHTVLNNFLKAKRRARSADFDADCLTGAGDLCRREGKVSAALGFYTQVRDYRRILSLDLSSLMYADTGSSLFFDMAQDIARNCPTEIYGEQPLSILHVAWAVRILDDAALFEKLMRALDGLLPDTGPLRAEWALLSCYLHYPRLNEMLPVVRGASRLFDGGCSQVVLPKAPWAFYEFSQMAAFHTQMGAADEEAGALDEFIAVYSRLTDGHGNGADALFRAELAFQRCDAANAEIYAYKAIYLSESKHQRVIQIGAAKLLAELSLLKADVEGWQRAVGDMEKAATGLTTGSEQNTLMYSAVFNIALGGLLAELRDYTRIAEWLKYMGFTSRPLPGAVTRSALAVHFFFLLGQGDYAKLIGLGQTLSPENNSISSAYYHYLLMAAGYLSIGDRARAAECVETSADIAVPDGMLHHFAVFSRLLQNLPDEILEGRRPDVYARFKGYKEQYVTGWLALHNALVANELPFGLTGREREVALLAAEGMRNQEIAEKLYVSENTVRAHLRAVYHKLDIDRRAKLVKVLK